jgi:hypothetical protein
VVAAACDRAVLVVKALTVANHLAGRASWKLRLECHRGHDSDDEEEDRLDEHVFFSPLD